MNLDTTSLKLEAVLAGAVAANQPEVTVDYVVWNVDGVPSKPLTTRTALNSATDVTILTAPSVQGIVKEPIRVSLYNKDTASVTVTVKTDDGTTERIVCKHTLLPLETLHFEKGAGWYAIDANGNRKEVTASTFSSITVTGLTANRIPVAGTGGLLGDFSTLTYQSSGGLVVNNLVDLSGAAGGQIKFPAAQNASTNANTLDDYEEGTWTPVDSSGAGLSLTVNGTPTYTKIGHRVFESAQVAYPVTADGSTAILGGCPFTNANNASAQQGSLTYTNGAAVGWTTRFANTATFRFYQTGGGAQSTNANLSGAQVNVTGLSFV